VETIPGAGDQPPTAAAASKPNGIQLASSGPTYPFAAFATDPGRVIYRRSIAEPEQSSELHVVELIEQRYPSSEKAIQSLLRGDALMLPTVRPWEVASLEADGRFFVQPYAVPVTHLLQFNPRSKPLANRTLRRALAYGLSRKMIFEDVILRGPSEKAERLGRLTSAPFPTTSYAYATTVEPHKYDPALAMALTAGAKKELNGELPSLKMIKASLINLMIIRSLTLLLVILVICSTLQAPDL
jgi:ABC-type transport system substrate-binding protein